MSVVLDLPANTPAGRTWMRALVEDAGAARELHFLDTSDEPCLRRRRRNASGDHPFQVSDADYADFASCFVPPWAEAGCNLIVHAQ